MYLSKIREIDALKPDETESIETLLHLCFPQSRLQNNSRVFYTVNGRDETLAFVGVQEKDDGAYLCQLCTHPDKRRKGLARRLLGLVKGWYSGQTLVVYINKNEPYTLALHTFYVNQGFIETGEENDREYKLSFDCWC